MTSEEALEKLREISAGQHIRSSQYHSPESAHIDADMVLCELLKSLGYVEIVEVYESIGKWYA